MNSIFTRKKPSKDTKKQPEEAKSEPEKTDDTKPPIDWWGVQLLHKAKGTNEIMERSYPFWATSIQEVQDHARRTNKEKNMQMKTHWTHIAVFAKTVETADGNTSQHIKREEIKL